MWGQGGRAGRGRCREQPHGRTRTGTDRHGPRGVGRGGGTGQWRAPRGWQGGQEECGRGERGRGWCREQPHGRTRTDTDEHGPRGVGDGARRGNGRHRRGGGGAKRSAGGGRGGGGGAGNSHTDGHGLTRTDTDREAGARGRDGGRGGHRRGGGGGGAGARGRDGAMAGTEGAARGPSGVREGGEGLFFGAVGDAVVVEAFGEAAFVEKCAGEGAYLAVEEVAGDVQ